MRSLLSTILLASLVNIVLAEGPTFSEDVAQIIYNNCTQCHRQGDIAPFVLETYDQVFSWSPSIKIAVMNGIMPPWLPDVTYSRFSKWEFLIFAMINIVKIIFERIFLEYSTNNLEYSINDFS